MSKSHTVTQHHVFGVYNYMLNCIDAILPTVANKKTQLKDDLYFTVKFAQQTLSQFYAEVTPITGMHIISAQIMNAFRNV